MAWKYKQEYVKDGDVIEPSEWRINVNETLSEINGYLDSDNIAEASIDASLIGRKTFTDVFSSSVSPNDSFIFNHEQSGWQRTTLKHRSLDYNSLTMQVHPSEVKGSVIGGAGSTLYEAVQDAQLPNITFTPDSDGLLICEFNGWVKWSRYNTHPDFVRDETAYDTTRFDNLHEYSFFADQKKYFKHYSSYVLCSQWRLTVNGQSIAESGPLGNEYNAHPIYLCGAAPILKNTQTVVQLEAQFIWYSLGKDISIQASSFAPLFVHPYATASEEPDSGGGSSHKVTDSDYNTQTYRNDCSLQNPFLTAIFRKR
tara:strand:- start:4680 stop:5615 length:936 start_codon:yes stop_codon:yes gene_type:complete